ncbi:MAG: ABC transporter permease, partial [Actinomycetota bacterium]|nr:ABC transporter permease [Actinomycetota bacterium]
MRFNLGFFLAEAFKNVRLNLLMSITAVTTTFVCILIFGMGLLVSSHVDGIVGSVREDVTVEVFLPNAEEGEVDALLRETQGWPEVTSVNKVSEEEALADFRETFEEQPELYEDLDEGVLPPSLQLQLRDPEMADEVAARLKQEGFTDENLSYPQQTIERLNAVTSYMIWGLYGATVLFLIASVLLISNAIRLSIFARRKEIEVMKLVGASDGFVRTPFVLEGLVEGLIGAGLAALAVVWINFLFVDWA